MAADTPCAGRAGRVKVVRGRVVTFRQHRGESRLRLLAVASRAQGVARRFRLAAVRIVAIGAAHAALVHPALSERAVLVHLGELLAVSIVELGAQQLGPEVVE